VTSPVEAHVGGHEFRLGKDLLGWLQLLTKLGAFWDLEKERDLEAFLTKRGLATQREKKLQCKIKFQRLFKKRMAVSVRGIHQKAFL
jgi:hypothetical protein